MGSGGWGVIVLEYGPGRAERASGNFNLDSSPTPAACTALTRPRLTARARPPTHTDTHTHAGSHPPTTQPPSTLPQPARSVAQRGVRQLTGGVAGGCGGVFRAGGAICGNTAD
jgi:hypothetical protein